jgi:hypothetical protein
VQVRQPANQRRNLENFFRKEVIVFFENLDTSIAPPKQAQTNFACGSDFAGVAIVGSIR